MHTSIGLDKRTLFTDHELPRRRPSLRWCLLQISNEKDFFVAFDFLRPPPPQIARNHSKVIKHVCVCFICIFATGASTSLKPTSSFQMCVTSPPSPSTFNDHLMFLLLSSSSLENSMLSRRENITKVAIYTHKVRKLSSPRLRRSLRVAGDGEDLFGSQHNVRRVFEQRRLGRRLEVLDAKR